MVEDKFADFSYKVTGNSNCVFDETNTMVPVSGAYVMFVAEKDGTVAFAYKLNKTKTQYFVDENNKEVIANIPETTGSSVYLLTEFPVKAGVKYYTYTRGSKMDVFGFKYTVGSTTGITNVTTASSAKSSALYNLAGQQVNKDYKGVVIQNGKKFLNK